MTPDFYQIYHNNHPLSGQSFNSLKEARIGLKIYYNFLHEHSTSLGYDVVIRTSFVRNILGVKRVYADGFIVKDIYMIQRVQLQPVSIQL